MSDAWFDAQQAERAYWYPRGVQELLTRRESEKQQHLMYHQMADIPHEMRGTALELGCGPMPMLCDVLGHGELMLGIDPMLPEKDDLSRMEILGVTFKCHDAEGFRSAQQFDHVLMCNVLQHVRDPKAVLQTAVHHTKQHLYIFEWIHEPISPVHLHVITPELICASIPPEFVAQRCITGTMITRRWSQQFFAARYERPC